MIAVGEAEVLEFRAVIARRLGLWFDDHRREFLADLLRQRLAERNCGATAFLHRLAGPDAREEWVALAPPLTVAETYFLRGKEHLAAFVETVLPECARRAPGARPLRVVSAGCASGEEPYSLAICVHENAAAPGGRPVEIVGVDLNPEVLARARAARYSAWSLRETPPETREKYFQPDRKEFVLDESIRNMVTFCERNLAEPNDDLWPPGSCDVVFCRNMLMYFVPAVAAALVARFQRALVPGGFLFLGHAETLRGLSHGFHLRRSHDAFFYQSRAEDETAPEPPSGSAPLPARAAPPEPVAPATGWFEAIGRASARIAALAATTPGSTPPMPAAPRSGGIGRVLDLHRQERFTDALAQLEGLPAQAPGDADRRVLQAVLLVNCGRIAEAEALCRSLLGDDECNAGAHYVAGLCREHAGDLAGAEEHDAAAAYLDPAFAMPRFHLGLLAKRLGRAAKALGHFEEALALLAKEDTARLLLFGGGFARETLIEVCRKEIQRLHGP